MLITVTDPDTGFTYRAWPDRCNADVSRCAQATTCNRNRANNPAPSPWTNHNNLARNILDGVCRYYVHPGVHHP